MESNYYHSETSSWVQMSRTKNECHLIRG
jgi:hypothetical protein